MNSLILQILQIRSKKAIQPFVKNPPVLDLACQDMPKGDMTLIVLGEPDCYITSIFQELG